MKLSLSKKSIMILLAVAALATLLIVSASYVMTSPVSQNVVVNPTPTPTPSPTPTPAPATLSTVTVSATALTVGQSLTVTTQVSDHTEGIVVTFKTVTGDITVGTANTDATGLASFTFLPPLGQTRYYAVAVHP
jgi:hypothetical protein